MPFPLELTQYPQWAVCTGSPDPTGKAPVNGTTGRMVEVDNPRTFMTYAEAYAALKAYPFMGFIFSESDPYTVIDLDKLYTPERVERAQRILRAFTGTYAETSKSGYGIHIICRGSVPSGVKRDDIEMYSARRFMVMTGNTLVDAPIIDCQAMLDVLYAEASGGRPNLVDIDDGEECWMSDGTLVERALAADNGTKFDALTRGHMDGYPSQSEADLALMSILCFWTRDNAQVKRIFRCTKLGQRDKATKNDVYLNRCLQRIRSNELPLIDLSNAPALQCPLPQERALETTPVTANGLLAATTSTLQVPSSIAYPPGVLGEIAQYITESNIRPVPEIGLVAALAFVAGVIGRQYNISGTGLNQYLILMAPTGTGKEGAAGGIDRLFSALHADIPAVDTFLGPGAFASGQALIKRMAEKPCFVSVLGEFGLTMKRLSSKYISPADITLKQALLDLYQKSGWQSTLKSSVYSDKEKNSAIVQAPALTILGESTQESLLEELSPQLIADGLLPRFITIEYTGDRPPRNRNPFSAPSPALLQKVHNIVLTVLAMQANTACCQVAVAPDAAARLDAFDLECDKRISEMSEVYKHLWNRAHLKALKLAGLAAVADNPRGPCVSMEHATWAIDLVQKDIKTISKRFEDNSVGDGEVRLESLLRKTIEQYAGTPIDKRVNSYAIPRAVAEDPTVIPYHYLRRRFRLLTAFTQHRNGAKAAIKLCLDDCLEAGIIQELPLDQTLAKFGTRAKLYVQGPTW